MYDIHVYFGKDDFGEDDIRLERQVPPSDVRAPRAADS